MSTESRPPIKTYSYGSAAYNFIQMLLKTPSGSWIDKDMIVKSGVGDVYTEILGNGGIEEKENLFRRTDKLYSLVKISIDPSKK